MQQTNVTFNSSRLNPVN